MKVSNILLAILSIGLVSGTVDQESLVIKITDDNLDTVLSKYSVIMIKFYDPSCGHCQRMAQAYIDAAAMLDSKPEKYALGEVDVTANPKTADRFEIRAFPTLKAFIRGQEIEYTGGRAAQQFVDWLYKMDGPSYLESSESLEVLAEKHGVVYLCKTKSKDGEIYTNFKDHADSHRGTVQYVLDVSANHEDEIWVAHHKEPAVKMQPGDKLDDFLTKHSFPLVGPINGENFRGYIDRGLDLVWYCGSPSEYEETVGSLRVVAAKQTKYSFVWLDVDQFKGHAEMSLGITEFPNLVIQSKVGRYVLPDPSVMLKDEEKLDTFFSDVEAGKIEKSLKSEPVPSEQPGPVTVVVGKNFVDVVMDSTKDVFLMIYAPWCGHCKNFEPTYNQFGEAIAGNSHVVVAKMDGTANEIPVEGIEFSGFPTIMFFKSTDKTPMKYDKGRTLEQLMEFIKEHSTKPISEPSASGGAAAGDEL